MRPSAMRRRSSTSAPTGTTSPRPSDSSYGGGFTETDAGGGGRYRRPDTGTGSDTGPSGYTGGGTDGGGGVDVPPDTGMDGGGSNGHPLPDEVLTGPGTKSSDGYTPIEDGSPNSLSCPSAVYDTRSSSNSCSSL